MITATDNNLISVLADTVSQETAADVEISLDASAEAGSWDLDQIRGKTVLPNSAAIKGQST